MIWCDILSCSIMSYPVLLYHVMSYPALSYHILSCSIMSYPVLLYHVMSCPALSCHILSYPSTFLSSCLPLPSRLVIYPCRLNRSLLLFVRPVVWLTYNPLYPVIWLIIYVSAFLSDYLCLSPSVWLFLQASCLISFIGWRGRQTLLRQTILINILKRKIKG